MEKQVLALASGVAGSLGLGYLLARSGSGAALPVAVAVLVAALGVVLLPSAYGLILVVCEVLAAGLIIALLAWAQDAPAGQEYRTAGFELLAVATVLTVWLAASGMKDTLAAMRTKDATIAALTRHSQDGTLLSTGEFQRMARLVFAATRRHQEPATLIRLRLADSRVRGSLRARVARGVVAVTRVEFDVVGELDPDTIGVLLQDCDSAGAGVVLERLWRFLADAAVTSKARDLIAVDIEQVSWTDAAAPVLLGAGRSA